MSLNSASVRRISTLAYCTALLASCACGEISSPRPSGVGGSRAAGSGGESSGGGGEAGSANEGGTSSTGGSDSDAGLSDSGNEGGSGGTPDFMYPSGCPQPSPEPSDPEQSIAIQSVDFTTSEIVIRNVSSRAIEITGGPQGWQWCNIPFYDHLLDADLVLEPDQTLAFRLTLEENGRVVPLFAGGDEDSANEIGIYIGPGGFTTATSIAAFVVWDDSIQGSRETVAAGAFLWNYNERVEIQPGHSGFIATGPTDVGSGYTSVPARCLVAPPNPPGTVLPEPK